MCNKQHPSALHIKVKEAAVRSIQVSVRTDGHTGAGNTQRYKDTLAIVPVQVKSTKGSKIINTHAFLDPGSIRESQRIRESPQQA